MPDNCLDSNLHNNSGTSQAQRALEALSASYAKVDERSTADLILFAKKYGAYLNYYGANNAYSGDWGTFMSKDISVTIAALQNWQAKDYINYINNLYDNIKAGTPVVAQENFKYIFDFIFSIVKNINDVLSQLPADSDYFNYLNVTIASKLALPVKQLNDYYLLFLQPGNALNPVIFPVPAPTDSFAPFEGILFVPLGPVNFQSDFFFINNSPWTLPANIIPPSASMLTGDRINEIITNNFFTGAVTSFLNSIINIVNQTGSYLEKTLSNYPAHAPHYALYLSFIRLFKFARNHLNNYTERHLEFYYKKVLQLKNDLGLPDTTHLVFTLQKNVNQHLLSKGTQFKAGKDANNNDLFYALTDDIVVNQAAVQALKSLYLVKNYGSSVIQQQLFASTVANSADGQGVKLTSPDKSWYPFGDLSNTDFITKSSASVGFAIASNLLFLNEGTRTVTITFNCKQVDVSTIPSITGIFSAKFTGNKKWFDAADYLPDGTTNTVVVKNTPVAGITYTQLIITITLNGNAPPIIPYSQKIHGRNFTQALPMVQVLVGDYRYYSTIKSLLVSSVNIDIHVDKVKNIALQNDAGKIDTSKPFKPFGEFPDKGASLIIGSKEVFQKPLTSVNIHFTGLNFPNNSAATQSIIVAGSMLSAANWADLLDSANHQIIYTISGPTSIVNIPVPGRQPVIPGPDFTPDVPYKASSTAGFVKLAVNQPDYNLPHYLASVQAATATNSVSISGGTPPTTYQLNAPSTPQPVQPSPTANSLYLDYDARITFLDADKATNGDFNSRQNFFYHIEPFGFREMHPYLFSIPSETDTTIAENTLTVLPVFSLDNGTQSAKDKGQSSDPDIGGELWIGISGTQSGETYSILFEVSEGSSNPLKNTTTISWFYMSGNNWIAFDPQINVNDQTKSLSESGLIVFNVPDDATTNNTRADNNLLWLRAVVRNNADTVCKLITVQCNAAKAQFVVDPGHSIYFTKNIAANTISKPAIADAALKQTTQPYSSFGGRPKESNEQFDQCVSERLRHKHRAVTAWDYERLVLQNFPQIHKVKCLNHTSLKSNTQNYCEMKPGDVMIVTVPDLSLITGANPLLPFTSVGLLGDIKKYINQFCSPFVHLHVCNPQFEPVQFIFDVYFINNNENKSYRRDQLDMEIRQFLMPWAFGSVAADIEFGGKIEKSVVLNFVQTRPYVDFVTCFTMTQYVHQTDGTFKLLSSNLDEAVATTARSILVPYFDPKEPVDSQGNIIHSPANCTCND